ncbi:hypothetical protein JOD14_000438 [Enterococcus lemanii]|nr:hypothetical protein [Enterococcus lemanii]
MKTPKEWTDLIAKKTSNRSHDWTSALFNQ